MRQRDTGATKYVHKGGAVQCNAAVWAQDAGQAYSKLESIAPMCATAPAALSW